MSLTFFPIHKLLLNKNGRSRIMSKIKDIQDCYNWDSFDLSIIRSDLDLSYIKYEEPVKELNDWGNIAKLSVDLWSDYDYYYKFPLDTRFIGEQCRERLTDLGYICKDGTWESVRQPNEETVQLHVIMYCIYRLLSKEMDSKKDHCNTMICSFCDFEIVTDDDKCMHCGASLEDISELQTSIDMRLNENIFKMKEAKGMSDDNCQNKICGEEEVKAKMNEVGCDDGNDNDKLFERIEIEDLNESKMGGNINYNELGENDFKEDEMTQKWKCGACEYSNEYIHANCIVCGKLFEDGTWYCGQCTKENKGVNKVCDAYETINSKVNVTVNDGAARTINNEVISNQNACDKCGSFTNVREKRCKKCCGDSNIRADQWKCGKCSVIHGYGDKVCNTCDASRIGSGLWKCETCSMENKCEDTKCRVCWRSKDYLSAKYCDKCKINKVTHNNQYCDDCEKYNNEKYKPRQWKCQYPRCNEYNYNVEEYCSKCRLERNYSRARGENVKLWYDNEEKILWLCHKCYKINKSHELLCHVCRETRYRSKYCHKCRIYNDGTTNNCDQCYQKL